MIEMLNANLGVVAFMGSFVVVLIALGTGLYGLGRFTATTEIRSAISAEFRQEADSLRNDLTAQIDRRFSIIERDIESQFKLIRTDLKK